MENEIMLIGTRMDINRVLNAIDLFVFPSLYEGLPISVIEAQASGLPILCSETITQEVIVTDLCQMLPVHNTALWCDTIISRLKEISAQEYKRPDKYEQIVQSGYDITAAAHQLQDFYFEHIKNYNYRE